MFASLEEILKGHFSYEEDHNVHVESLLKAYYKYPAKGGAVVEFYPEYSMSVVVGHYWKDWKGNCDLAMYASDKEILRRSDTFCGSPLSMIPSVNYMYYGCYLSIVAFLFGCEPEKTTLTLYHVPDNHNKYLFKYRPEIADLFLKNRLSSLKAIENDSIAVELQSELF